MTSTAVSSSEAALLHMNLEYGMPMCQLSDEAAAHPRSEGLPQS